jgi:biotin synthase-like enzyme
MSKDIQRYTEITYQEAMNQLVLENFKENLPAHHNIGTWDCPNSPIKTCVYDIEKDPCEDDCIYCGQPDERK